MCILDTTGLFFTSLKASIHFSVNVLVGKIDRQLVKKSYKSFKKAHAENKQKSSDAVCIQPIKYRHTVSFLISDEASDSVCCV